MKSWIIKLAATAMLVGVCGLGVKAQVSAFGEIRSYQPEISYRPEVPVVIEQSHERYRDRDRETINITNIGGRIYMGRRGYIDFDRVFGSITRTSEGSRNADYRVYRDAMGGRFFNNYRSFSRSQPYPFRY